MKRGTFIAKTAFQILIRLIELVGISVITQIKYHASSIQLFFR